MNTMASMNRSWNCKNGHQGRYKKVLCVCSAGLLRSPTTAVVLSQEPYNFNTRAVGLNEDYALIPIDKVLVDWADEIVCMTAEQIPLIERYMPPHVDKPIICLAIQDSYEYRSQELMRMIPERYDLALKTLQEELARGEPGVGGTI